MTPWKCFWSWATQMRTVEVVPLVLVLAALVLVPPVELLELFLLLAQPASAMSAASATTARTTPGLIRLMVIEMLLSPGLRRCPAPCPDRRNAGCWCRRPLPRRRQPPPATAG